METQSQAPSPYRNVPVLSRASGACLRALQRDETPRQFIDAYDPTIQPHPHECSPEELLGAYPQVFGTLAAGTTAPAGAVAGAITMGLTGAALGTVLGPLGTAAGAVIGVVAGLATGWWGGGMVGGAVGKAVGKGLQKLRVEPPFGDMVVDSTKGFSLGKLAHNLLHIKYSSIPKLDSAMVDKIRSLAKPGDILVASREGNTASFEPIMEALQVGGDWVHTGLYNGEGQVYEQHASKIQTPHGSRARLSSLDEFVTRANHIMILRPSYGSDKEIQDTMAAARERLGEKYDLTFNLHRPDKMYCVAYTYLALEKGAPSVQLTTPDKRLGRDIVTPRTFQTTPGVGEVFSTGADFPMDYWSKFD